MIKKLTAIVLSCGMVLSLAACGGNSKSEQTAAPTKQEAAASGEKDAGKTEQPSEKETEKSAEADSVKADSTEKKDAGEPKSEASGPAAEVDLENFTIRTDVDKNAPFSIRYPDSLKDKYGDSVSLDHYPEKLIVLSTSSLYLMKHLGVEPIAVSRMVSTTLAADAYGDLPLIDSGMNTVDTEAIVAMEPDLVLMSGGMKDKFGVLLEDLSIPVYYTSEGPIVTYEMNKDESLCLAEAFGGKSAKEDVAKVYETLEKKMDDYAAAHDPMNMMILFGMDSSYQASSLSYFGSILQKLGFVNLTDQNEGPQVRVAPGSMENVISYNPDAIFLIAPPTGYDPAALKGAFLKRVEGEEELWKDVRAVKEKRILAFPGNFTTSKGFQAVHDISTLIDTLQEELKD